MNGETRSCRRDDGRHRVSLAVALCVDASDRGCGERSM